MDDATPTPPQAVAIDMDAIAQEVEAEIALAQQIVAAKQAELHQAELRLARAEGQRALIGRMLSQAARP